MSLTAGQRTTLKTAIAAETTVTGQPGPFVNTAVNAVPNSGDGNNAIAFFYNQPSNPAFIVWRTLVSVEEVMAAFTWTEIDALTAGKARIWQWMSQLGKIDPSKANVRQGIADGFATATSTLGNTGAGTGGIQPVVRRTATRGEKLFATGTGSVAAPGTMVVEGALSDADITDARNNG